MNENSPHPFDNPTRIERLAGQMQYHIQELDPWSAPAIEPALLAPIWTTGDIVLFCGAPGCGKTFLASDILVGAIARQRKGSCLGGLLQFDQSLLGDGRIGILDIENDAARWSSMLREKLEHEGLQNGFDESRLRYIPVTDLNLHNSKEWTDRSKALALALKQAGIKFFIGDTIARIWSPDDVNAYAWVQQGFAPFRLECRKLGISGLMLSHTKRPGGDRPSKPTGPIGTSFQDGQADGIILINPTTQGNRRGIELILRKSRRSRWIQQGSKVVVLFTDGYGYQPIGDWRNRWPHEPPNPTASEPSATQSVLEYLRQASPESVTCKDISAKINVPDRTVRLHLNSLLSNDQVEKTGGGRSTRWRVRNTELLKEDKS